MKPNSRDFDRPQNRPDYSVNPITEISKISRVIPVGEMSWVMLMFPLPPQTKFYRTDPTSFITYLITDKGHEFLTFFFSFQPTFLISCISTKMYQHIEFW